MDDNSLTHTKWECKYHIVFYRNSDGKQYTESIRQTYGKY